MSKIVVGGRTYTWTMAGIVVEPGRRITWPELAALAESPPDRYGVVVDGRLRPDLYDTEDAAGEHAANLRLTGFQVDVIRVPG